MSLYPLLCLPLFLITVVQGSAGCRDHISEIADLKSKLQALKQTHASEIEQRDTQTISRQRELASKIHTKEEETMSLRQEVAVYLVCVR